jgi:GDP-mannose 6-dehydrogenase
VLGKGFDIRIYDKYVSIARLIGANRRYIEKEIPHISGLIKEKIRDLVAFADVLVIGNHSPEFARAVKKLDKNKMVIDLVRIVDDPSKVKAAYYGICW